MKKITQLMMAAATACTMLLVSCGGSSHGVAVTKSEVVAADHGNLEEQILFHVNQYRATKGVKPLVMHKGLSRIADDHSAYMRKHTGEFGLIKGQKSISHYGFDGRAVKAKHKHGIENLGENVLSGSGTAAEMVRAWISSPEHEHNMTMDWDVSGISSVAGPDGRVWVTQLFGSAPKSNLVGGEMVGAPRGW